MGRRYLRGCIWGVATPFCPLPPDYVPKKSCIDVLRDLLRNDSRVVDAETLLRGILEKTASLMGHSGALPSSSGTPLDENEVTAIVAVTGTTMMRDEDGASYDYNYFFELLNDGISQSNLTTSATISDWYWYLIHGLNKIPREALVVYEGIRRAHHTTRTTADCTSFAFATARQDLCMEALESEGGTLRARECVSAIPMSIFSLDGVDEAEYLLPPMTRWETTTTALGPQTQPNGEKDFTFETLREVEPLSPWTSVFLTAVPYLHEVLQREMRQSKYSLYALGASSSSTLTETTFPNRMSWKDGGLTLINPAASRACQAVGYWALGHATVKDGRPISHGANGGIFTSRKCFLAAVEHDDSLGEAYCGLGHFLEEYWTVQGEVELKDARVLNSLECFVEAIAREDSLADAYIGLGKCLSYDNDAEAVVVLKDGRQLNARACFSNAITRGAATASTYCALGNALLDTHASATVAMMPGSRAMSSQDCFLKAIELNPLTSEAYCGLGRAMSNDPHHDVVTLTTGSTMTNVDCFVEAIRLNDGLGLAYFFLGHTMRASTSPLSQQVTLENGRVMSYRECLAESVVREDLKERLDQPAFLRRQNVLAIRNLQILEEEREKKKQEMESMVSKAAKNDHNDETSGGGGGDHGSNNNNNNVSRRRGVHPPRRPAARAFSTQHCFVFSQDLPFDSAVRALCSMPSSLLPEWPTNDSSRSSNCAVIRPRANTAQEVIDFVVGELALIKEKGHVSHFELSDDELCALICLTIVDTPFPILRWMNLWLVRPHRDDVVVQRHVGPLFKLMHFGLKKVLSVVGPVSSLAVDVSSLDAAVTDAAANTVTFEAFTFFSPNLIAPTPRRHVKLRAVWIRTFSSRDDPSLNVYVALCPTVFSLQHQMDVETTWSRGPPVFAVHDVIKSEKQFYVTVSKRCQPRVGKKGVPPPSPPDALSSDHEVSPPASSVVPVRYEHEEAIPESHTDCFHMRIPRRLDETATVFFPHGGGGYREDEKRHEGFSVVHAAIFAGNSRAVDYICTHLSSSQWASLRTHRQFTALHAAALADSRGVFGRALESCRDLLDVKTTENLTVAQAAARNLSGNCSVLEFLSSRANESLRCVDHEGCTLAMHAAQSGNVATVELILGLLRNDDILSQRDRVRGRTVVMHAALSGVVYVLATVLCNHGCGLTTDVDIEGLTIGMYAAQNGDCPMFEFIVDCNSDCVFDRDKNDQTVAMHAASVDMLTLILDRGGSPTDYDIHFDTVAVHAARNSVDMLKTVFERGGGARGGYASVAIEAINTKDTHLLKTVFDLGASPRDVDLAGMTIAMRGVVSADPDLVGIIFDSDRLSGGGVDALRDRDVNGKTVAMYVVQCATPDILALALSLDPTVLSHRDNNGMTMLMYAVCGSNVAMVEDLLARGCNVDDVDHRGRTAAMYAVWCTDSTRVLQHLLEEADASVTIRDENGCTLAMHAAWSGNTDLFGQVIANGGVMTDADHAGNTVAAYAAHSGNPDMVRLLREMGQ